MPGVGYLLRKQGDGRAEAGTNFPTAFFFAAVACRRQRLEAIPPQKFPRWGKIHRKQGDGRTEADTNYPTAFFLRLSPVGGSGWKPPTDDGKIHRCRRRSAGRVREQQQERRQNPRCRRRSAGRVREQQQERRQNPRCRRRSAGRARGQQQERRQNPPLPQVFSWPGSRTANGGRCSAGRAREQQTGAGGSAGRGSRAAAARAETLKNANGNILFSQLGKLCRGRLLRL